MDKEVWKPFMFEVLIFVGKLIGTKNDIFKRLFLKDKAYLMGKLLTVETRLKSYKDSYMPVLGNLNYTETEYKRMLCELIDILVINGEHEMAT